MRSVIIAPILCLLLSGCETAVFEKLGLPDVINYSIEVQERAAQEVETNYCPVLNEFTKDYGVMRDQTRVARGENVSDAPR